MEGTKKVISSVMRSVATALKVLGVDSLAVKSLGGEFNSEPLGETYYSATPYRYGEYIAKFSMAPLAPGLIELTAKIIDLRGRNDAILRKCERKC